MLVDQNGIPVRLGRQIGRSGGEGSAYSADSHPGFVAKIYHKPPNQDKAAKLRYLTKVTTFELQKCSAWPALLISDESRLRGFLMPVVGGKEIHELFGPRDRVVEFPGKNWDFLINTARNCAVAFHAVHSVRAVIGDVNEGNVLVKATGDVRLIDCDSYQISDGAVAWTCDVGVSLWTPPELQGRDFTGLVRTSNHDLFGLALMVFKLLFQGRHPFAGVPTDESEYLLEDAIRKRLYAFSPNANAFGIRPAPYTFPVAALGEPYVAMFERAFRLEVARPTANEWVGALDSLQSNLTRCSQDSSHLFPKHFKSCPWCDIAAAGGPLFFVSIDVTAVLPSTGGVEVVWAAICRVQRVALVPKSVKDFVVPAVEATALPQGIHKTNPLFIVALCLLAAALWLFFAGGPFLAVIAGVFAVGMLCEGRREPEFVAEGKRRQSVLSQTERDIAAFSMQLAELSKNYESAFAAKAAELKQAYDRYRGSERERASEMQTLERKKQELQLNEFLRAQLISQAKIPGIGNTRKTRLLSFGIGSALDIGINVRIPGFGPANMSHLVNWRMSCEARFRFEPTRPVPAIEVQRLNMRITASRDSLLSVLKAGPGTLTTLSAGAQGRYLQLQGQLEIAIRRRAQAEADCRLCQ